MKHDVLNRHDIIQLVDTFYQKVQHDPQIGHFFTEVMAVDWQTHLPKVYDFWEGVVFNTGGYTGNPMQVHKDIHERHPFTPADFTQWHHLFSSTADELFTGDNTELMKQRAFSVSTLMQIRVAPGQSLL